MKQRCGEQDDVERLLQAVQVVELTWRLRQRALTTVLGDVADERQVELASFLSRQLVRRLDDLFTQVADMRQAAAA